LWKNISNKLRKYKKIEKGIKKEIKEKFKRN